MFKAIAAGAVCAMWFNYATGKDTKPVGKSVHYLTHALYFGLLAATVVFVP